MTPAFIVTYQDGRKRVYVTRARMLAGVRLRPSPAMKIETVDELTDVTSTYILPSEVTQ